MIPIAVLITTTVRAVTTTFITTATAARLLAVTPPPFTPATIAAATPSPALPRSPGFGVLTGVRMDPVTDTDLMPHMGPTVPMNHLMDPAVQATPALLLPPHIARIGLAKLQAPAIRVTEGQVPDPALPVNKARQCPLSFTGLPRRPGANLPCSALLNVCNNAALLRCNDAPQLCNEALQRHDRRLPHAPRVDQP